MAPVNVVIKSISGGTSQGPLLRDTFRLTGKRITQKDVYSVIFLCRLKLLYTYNL